MSTTVEHVDAPAGPNPASGLSPEVSARVIAVDHETHLWETGKVAPRIVCCSVAQRSPIYDLDTCNEDSIVETDLMARDEGVREFLAGLYAPQSGFEVVGHHYQFDMACQVSLWPELLPLVFAALEQGRVHDTEIREKLLNLATHGQLRSWAETEDLATEQDERPRGLIEYNLAALVANYLGRDRKDEKEAEDGWRKNYALLDGVPAAEYPPEAAAYARDDASDPLLVYGAQEIRRHSVLLERGQDPFATEGLQVAAAFALQLMTCHGWRIDPKAKREVEAFLARELDPAKHEPLYKAKILTPAVPPRAYKNGAKNEDGTPKMTPPEPEHLKRKPLLALVEKTCADHGIDLERNDPTEKEKAKAEAEGREPVGSTKATSDVIERLANFEPLLEVFRGRQKVMKLLTTELPRMDSPINVVHGVYEVLVSTGRTSCHDTEDYASANLQNVDPRARKCYVPREGKLLLSCDYAQLEFCSMGQKCYSLFGYSTIRDKVNSGVDTHAFFGSRLALELHEDFRQACQESGVSDTESVFEAFRGLEHHESEAAQAIYKKFRKMAKPCNFGFPGGLGAKKFVTFARANPYNVAVTEEQAKQLKAFWLETWPEMKDYFRWVSNSCVDQWNGKDTYAYVSPLGMLRSGATYCAACNGAMLQTPAAEGAKVAVFEVSRACYDPSQESVLYGCRPLAFVHDEIILEVPEDGHEHERALEVCRLMVESMAAIMPDLRIKAKPVLTRRWNKDAEATYDARNRLIVTETKA